MKIKCLHGYFIFEETKVSQVSTFMSVTGLSLVPKENYFTFEFIKDAPDYSLVGKAFLGFTAKKTFAGKPWEVFEQNGVVYDFVNDKIVPIDSVVQRFSVRNAGDRFVSSGLILPGSITEDGDRVRDYEAWYSRDSGSWLYTGVGYV